MEIPSPPQSEGVLLNGVSLAASCIFSGLMKLEFCSRSLTATVIAIDPVHQLLLGISDITIWN